MSDHAEQSLSENRYFRNNISNSSSESGRDWRKDFRHENGNYINICSTCKFSFKGHKRRITCRLCQDKFNKKGGGK